jgi:cell volume regulation protein A
VIATEYILLGVAVMLLLSIIASKASGRLGVPSLLIFLGVGVLEGVPQAETVFNLVFFIVLTSVLLQGTSLPIVARWLAVDAPLSVKRRYPLKFVSTSGFKIKSELVEIPVPADSPAVGKRIIELGLLREALIMLLARGEELIVLNGGTHLEAGDTMLVLADK